MAHKIKLELTEKEFEALIAMIDNCSAALSGEHEGVEEDVKKCDKMLLKNGYKRTYS